MERKESIKLSSKDNLKIPEIEKAVTKTLSE